METDSAKKSSDWVTIGEAVSTAKVELLHKKVTESALNEIGDIACAAGVGGLIHRHS